MPRTATATSKWGTLDERETNIYSTTDKRRTKQLEYHDYSDNIPARQITLNQHAQYLSSLDPLSTKCGLTLAQHHSLLSEWAREQWVTCPDIRPFQLAVIHRDIRTLKLLATVFFSLKTLTWSKEVTDKFILEVLLTNDYEIYEIVFYTQAFVYIKTSEISERLVSMYRSSDSIAKLERFHDIFTFFLDIGGNAIVAALHALMEVMISLHDTTLMQIMLTHEAIHYYFGQDIGFQSPLDTLLRYGDSAAEFITMAISEFPQFLNPTRHKESPLIVAAKNGQSRVVSGMLTAAKDKIDSQLITRAFEESNYENIKQILKPYLPKPDSKTGKIPLTHRALKRIMQDWREVMQDPACPESVRAFPREDNMAEWHVIITPPRLKVTKHFLSGVNFHFVMTFPNDYPISPPEIKGNQYLPHPNYHNGYLCLSMLRPFSKHDYGMSYSGWSSAYSANSIMMQLQSFLFAKEIDQDYGDTATANYSHNNIQRAYRECIEFKCETCGFNHTWKGFELPMSSVKFPNLNNQLLAISKLPYMSPPLTNDTTITTNSNSTCTTSSMKDTSVSLTTLPHDMILKIMDFLPRTQDIISILRVNKQLRNMEQKYSIWRRRELVCFYSKASFLDTILGIGINVVRGNNGKISTITSPLDFLSKNAFLKEGVRTSAWQEPINYWLPVVIDNKHGEQAFPYLLAGIAAIALGASFSLYGGYGITITIDALRAEHNLLSFASKFHPLMALDVIPKLMNQAIVSIVQDHSNNNKIVDTHHSEKALQGYSTFHHLLLFLCARFPAVIQHRIDHVLEQFSRHESARVKIAQPDLGELLVYLSVASHVTWQQIGAEFLQEALDRSVVWMLDSQTGKGRGELAYLEPNEVCEYRLRTSMDATLTSKRLLMFQVLFLNKVGRPSGLTPTDVLNRLNASYGAPPAGVAAYLQKQITQIYKVRTWEDFYKRINLPCPDKPQLTTMLRQSIINSERKGYHVNRLTEQQLLEWRKKVDPSITKKPKAFKQLPPKEAFPSLIPAASPLSTDSPTLPPTPPVSSQNEELPSQNEQSPSQNGVAAHNDSSVSQNGAEHSQNGTTPSENGTTPSQNGNEHSHSSEPTTQNQTPTNPPVKIFVGNLSYRVTPLDLEFVFQQFGKLVSSQVVYDANNKSRGFGFIEVENEDIATTLFDFMQGADVDRRPIRLERVGTRPRKTPNKPYQTTYYY